MKIPAEERYSKHKITIHGLQMAYVDEGKGDPILFLHGNPSEVDPIDWTTF